MEKIGNRFVEFVPKKPLQVTFPQDPVNKHFDEFKKPIPPDPTVGNFENSQFRRIRTTSLSSSKSLDNHRSANEHQNVPCVQNAADDYFSRQNETRVYAPPRRSRSVISRLVIVLQKKLNFHHLFFLFDFLKFKQ